ncbi:Kynurenine formamidase [Cinara cedri]|uniref:Kynurenine formamidase n=1 Tax=Cinara cedri TaxID=506608 RepID=A0A5E4NNZ5_9HEMI|nr:Kynurenine formamidase [Cinara cedri]
MVTWHFIFAVFFAMTVPKRAHATVFDLTHGYRNYTTTCWSSQEHFKVFDQILNTEPNNWYVSESISLSEHCGTHLDAPFHFNPDGWKLDEIPIERLFVEGVHVNVSSEVNGNGDFLLTADHLKAWETINGPLPYRCVILVNFGWAHKFGDRQSYYGSSESPKRCPGLSKDASQWIADSGKVFGIGVDGPTIDACNSSSFDAHKIFAKKNLYNLENVALNGTSLPSRGFKLIVQPIKIIGGTGGPARIFALIRRYES